MVNCGSGGGHVGGCINDNKIGSLRGESKAESSNRKISAKRTNEQTARPAAVNWPNVPWINVCQSVDVLSAVAGGGHPSDY